MRRHLYYGREGEPISQAEWVSCFEDLGYCHVGMTAVGEAEVSTVWLGLDHSMGLGGPPIIYESLVFGGELDGQGERYATLEAAEAGHERWVAAVREAAGVRNGG